MKGKYLKMRSRSFFSVGIEENKTRILTYNSIYLPTYFKIFQLLTIMVFLHIQFFCLPWQYGGVKFGETPLPVLTFILRASSKDQCNLLRSLSALWQKFLEALPSSSKSTYYLAFRTLINIIMLKKNLKWCTSKSSELMKYIVQTIHACFYPDLKYTYLCTT